MIFLNLCSPWIFHLDVFRRWLTNTSNTRYCRWLKFGKQTNWQWSFQSENTLNATNIWNCLRPLNTKRAFNSPLHRIILIWMIILWLHHTTVDVKMLTLSRSSCVRLFCSSHTKIHDSFSSHASVYREFFSRKIVTNFHYDAMKHQDHRSVYLCIFSVTVCDRTRIKA